MAKKYDYSNYQQDEIGKEKARHRGNASISFDVFQNRVVELKDQRALLVYVDDFFEAEHFSHIFADHERYASVEAYLDDHYKNSIKDNPDYVQMESEKIETHKQIISHYAQKFEIGSLYDKDTGPERAEALTSPLTTWSRL